MVDCLRPGHVLGRRAGIRTLGVGSYVRALVLVSIVLSCPHTAKSQERVVYQVGGGFGTNEWLDLATGHGLIGATLQLSPSVGMFIDSFVGVGDPVELGKETFYGSSAGLHFWWLREGLRPYAGVGVSFIHTSLSSTKPFSHDMGAMFRAGVEVEVGGDRWFAEMSPRAFGNIFYDAASTKSINLFTVGVWF